MEEFLHTSDTGGLPLNFEGRKLSPKSDILGITIAFYDKAGERLGTLHTGCAPQLHSGDGKEDLWFLMERDLAAVKVRYPKARDDSVSDGLREFVPWLQQITGARVLDFYHAVSCLAGAGDCFPDSDLLCSVPLK